jgi:hypothetical protein
MTSPALSAISIVLGLALMGSVVAMPAADQRLMISGTLEVIEEDLHGDPKLLAIVSPELGRYRISPDRLGRKLLAHVGKWVTIFGTVEMENGMRVVRVEGYRPIALVSHR